MSCGWAKHTDFVLVKILVNSFSSRQYEVRQLPGNLNHRLLLSGLNDIIPIHSYVLCIIHYNISTAMLLI